MNVNYRKVVEARLLKKGLRLHERHIKFKEQEGYFESVK